MALNNFAVRTLITAVGAPLILYLSWRGGVAFLIFIEVVAWLALREFYVLTETKLAQPSVLLGGVASFSLGAMLYFYGHQYAWLLLVIIVMLTVGSELFRNNGSALLNSAATWLGFGYVGVLLNFLLMLRELPRQLDSPAFPYADGGTWVVMLFVTVWVCDTAAYLFGSRFGRHKLFERVSPKKTIEGAVAGLVAAVATAWVCQLSFVTGLRLRDALMVGVICGTVGQLSDLVESRFKRDAGVKDSSSLIPGHGGILDRFDSEMLAAPVTYLYLLISLPK